MYIYVDFLYSFRGRTVKFYPPNFNTLRRQDKINCKRGQYLKKEDKIFTKYKHQPSVKKLGTYKLRTVPLPTRQEAESAESKNTKRTKKLRQISPQN